MKKFNIETEKLLVNEWEERAEWINSTLKNSNDSNQNTDNASNIIIFLRGLRASVVKLFNHE